VNTEIEELLDSSGGIIRRSDHPKLLRRLDRLRAKGELASPLPGVLWRPGLATDVNARIRAGQIWAPNAILTGMAAARLTFWPEAPVTTIDLVHRHHRIVDHGDWRLAHRLIPIEQVVEHGGLRLTSPALTAVDLAAGENGGDVIDRALRSRHQFGITLDRLWEAFESQPKRLGNPARAAILHDSRDNPWSEGERELHRLFRVNQITGWKANVTLQIGAHTYHPDTLFQRQRLIAEFDGREFHTDAAAFENDRYRRNELVLAGYCVLNFTWHQLIDDPDWVISCVRRALGDAR
jgi:very-short-patch-repair endonuclease